MKQDHNSLDANLATFSARVVAFAADAGVFILGYFLSVRAFFPGDFLTASAHSWFLVPFWMAAFILYHTFYSAGGRRTIGKALVGLRVVDEENQAPLTLDLALARSVMYLLSSVLELGFLWSLFQERRQCWHDMVVGSIVVDSRDRAPFERTLLRAGALAVMTLVAGTWYWNNLARPRYEAILHVAYAQTGVDEMKDLEKLYYYEHGHFTENLTALAYQSGEPKTFMRDMSKLFDYQAGIRIKADTGGYRIEARANDDAKTLIAANGP